MSASVRVNPSDAWAVETIGLTAAAAPTQVAGQDPFRMRVTVIADADNTVPVILAPSTGGKTRGFPLQPGAALQLDTTAAVFGYVASSTSQQLVYVLAETGVC